MRMGLARHTAVARSMIDDFMIGMIGMDLGCGPGWGYDTVYGSFQ